MEVNFINIVNKAYIDWFKTNFVPRENDHVFLDNEEWIVNCVVYDYVHKKVDVFVRKATSRDVTYCN